VGSAFRVPATTGAIVPMIISRDGPTRRAVHPHGKGWSGHFWGCFWSCGTADRQDKWACAFCTPPASLPVQVQTSSAGNTKEIKGFMEHLRTYQIKKVSSREEAI